MRLSLLFVFTCLMGVACGFSDPGTGTQALGVQGTFDCSFATMQTEVQFNVSGTEAALANANITLVDADTRETLHVPPSDEVGTYRARWAGYHRRVEIQIWAEAQGLSAHMEGPGKHTLVLPRTGATLRPKESLQVAWATADGVRADEVTLQLSHADATQVLTYDGGTARFTPQALGQGRETVTVRRSQYLILAGAAEGSRLRHSYSVATEFINAP
jgi:hypothetical protein